jgi:hypothetical protein
MRECFDAGVRTLCAQWYRACGVGLLRIVIVATDQGTMPIRVFFYTDAEAPVVRILETYASRWGIEVWNRDSKQDFGFADSPAWSEMAVRRTAPWAGLLSELLVVWFHGIYGRVDVPLPERPWYSWKEDLSFADLVRTARRMLRPVEIVGWARAVVAREPSAFAAAPQRKNTVESCSTEVNETPWLHDRRRFRSRSGRRRLLATSRPRMDLPSRWPKMSDRS